MSTTRIAREISINAPRHDVWMALSDFGHVSLLNPNINQSYLTSSQQAGVGTTRHCDITPVNAGISANATNATIEERVTAWEEDICLEVDAYDIENLMSLTAMHEAFELEEDGDQTVLRGTLEYEVSEEVGSIVNKLVIDRTNIKSWTQLLAGTREYVETHTPVNANATLRTEDVRTVL